MTRDELATAIELRLIAHSPDLANDILDLFRQREETIVDRCRAAINAERNYQSALHERVGSRYSAERHARSLAWAREQRERTAQEVGL